MNPAPPWAELPADVAERLRPRLPEVVDEVIVGIAREVPAYQRPLEGSFGRGIRLGVEVALGRFLDLPGTSQPAITGADREVYVGLGRGELRQGRPLEALLAAYRVGARVAFRRFAELARTAGLEPDALVPLAEATFAYIDEISAASVEGFAAEQSARAGERDRLRAELVGLVLSGTADPVAAQDAARAAGWLLPDAVVPVLVPPAQSDGLAVSLGPHAVVATVPEGVVALLPEPATGSRWRSLRRQLAGRAAVLGVATPWPETATSLRLASLAARLVEQGVLAGDPVVVEEHLVQLVVHRDEQLIAVLRSRELAPLEQAREAARDRLAETLLAWLTHHGERQRVAEALHVHPQTVAYRMTQLRQLFGEALVDPDRRFALELALRGR
jgi:hypothetical protein